MILNRECAICFGGEQKERGVCGGGGTSLFFKYPRSKVVETTTGDGEASTGISPTE